jgi:hypothetical protein
MTKEEIIKALVHEIWVQNLSHFGTLAHEVYDKDAEYMYWNLVKRGVLKDEPSRT